MKEKFIVLSSVLLFFLSSHLFANCGGCSPCARPCGPYETQCQCTDPNAYNNPCFPPDKFCEAFGNVGGR